jgi:hypothetical protein
VPSLSDKLKSLGVKVGAQDLNSPRPEKRSASSMDAILGGAPRPTPFGETYAIEKRFSLSQAIGHARLALNAPRHVIARWSGHPAAADLETQAFAFIDTETTGLSLGVGTYAYLISIGRFDAHDFHLAQFFLRDPAEEPAFLAAVEAFLAPCQAIVTYNGKTFDLPLLRTRFTAHGLSFPLQNIMHIDLLHLARRLWRDRLPERSLSYLEAHILGIERSTQDVPGWMAPEIYFQYLQTGDPTVLTGILYHNAMDVLSLAALLDHMSALLADPLVEGSQHGVDLIAMGRLFEDLGDLETATRLYIHGLEHKDALEMRLPRSVYLQALHRLALIYKRQSNWEAAIQLWQEASRQRHLPAFIELAKCYEHVLKDAQTALQWTQAAMEFLATTPLSTGDAPPLGLYERRQWMGQLQRRMERLQQKLAGYTEVESDNDER